ncbi:MAG: sensor histidine kinase [Acetatifactor sp.]|nr:sensor histidine kinase [Acetatifactor sp.]
MTGKRIWKGILYLLLIAAMSVTISGFLAGICCKRLEEYRSRDSDRQQRLEYYTRIHAVEIMQIYLSQGMEQVEQYVAAENVSFVLRKTSGRRLGGNYWPQAATLLFSQATTPGDEGQGEDHQTRNEGQIQKRDGQTQQYSYWFVEDKQGKAQQVSEEFSQYVVEITYFTEEQIQTATRRLIGIPDDLQPWMKRFLLSSKIALAAVLVLLGCLIRINGPNIKKQQRYAQRMFRMPLERLGLWLAAAILVWLGSSGEASVWEIPITWQDGPEPVMQLLGESLWRMTLRWLLLGSLLTGFVLHIAVYIRRRPARQQSIAGRVFRGPGRVWEQLPWLWKVLIILVLACGLEAVGMVLLQYGAAPQSRLSGRSVWIIWFLWALEKLVLAALVLRTAGSVMRLRSSAGELAKGNLGYQIPLEGMVGELLQFGGDMNAISHVVAEAVEDQTRSEHLKTELVTNVSHDIKTPLTSIINYADLIGREPTDNEQITEYAQVLHRQSTRLKKLIEDLIEVSKATTGNLEIYLERCQAGVLLSQAMGEFEQRLQEREIEVIIRQDKEPVWILADPRILWRILDNLMTNICKYAQSATRVYLILETREKQAVLTFKNISSYPLDTDASELMERFVRGDRSRHTEGSGLGLSIARSLTELQGGSMYLATDGDLFKVTLEFPIAEEEKQDCITG